MRVADFSGGSSGGMSADGMAIVPEQRRRSVSPPRERAHPGRPAGIVEDRADALAAARPAGGVASERGLASPRPVRPAKPPSRRGRHREQAAEAAKRGEGAVDRGVHPPSLRPAARRLRGCAEDRRRWRRGMRGQAAAAPHLCNARQLTYILGAGPADATPATRHAGDRARSPRHPTRPLLKASIVAPTRSTPSSCAGCAAGPRGDRADWYGSPIDLARPSGAHRALSRCKGRRGAETRRTQPRREPNAARAKIANGRGRGPDAERRQPPGLDPPLSASTRGPDAGRGSPRRRARPPAAEAPAPREAG